MRQQVLIIGGGVIGFLSALELAKADVDVVLLERGQTGKEASWAGGGIVSPLYPCRYSQPVTQLATWAQDYYPQLANEIIAACGIDPELTQTGLLMLDAKDAEKALAWAQENHRPMVSIDSQQVYQQEMNLREGFNSGLWMPEVSNIRNPRLLKALKAWLQSHPRVTLLEENEVTNFEITDDRVTGVFTQHDRITADSFVIAAGAWSGQLLAKLGVTLPVEPVRGQMLLFKDCAHLIKSIVLTDGKYLIPRRDGRLLVGSTLEKVGFDKRTTTEGKELLLKAAYKLLPALQDFSLEAHWAGLRPAAPNGIPFIGQVPRFSNLYINAGQYRNGLVLAPASAKLLSDILLSRKSEFDISPYQMPELI